MAHLVCCRSRSKELGASIGWRASLRWPTHWSDETALTNWVGRLFVLVVPDSQALVSFRASRSVPQAQQSAPGCYFCDGGSPSSLYNQRIRVASWDSRPRKQTQSVCSNNFVFFFLFTSCLRAPHGFINWFPQNSPRNGCTATTLARLAAITRQLSPLSLCGCERFIG